MVAISFTCNVDQQLVSVLCSTCSLSSCKGPRPFYACVPTTVHFTETFIQL